MKNKKVIYTIIGIVSIVLISLAITYAYWQITKTQEGVNEISSACLDISLVDAESGNTGVTLLDQYPLSDTEGAALKPYKFTVTNNCDVAVDYQIALESIGDSTKALSASSLKIMLDHEIQLLDNKEGLTPTITGAYASHKLGMSSLAAKGEGEDYATHELRLWIDEDAPVSENNKTYTGKVTVTIGQGIDAPTFKSGTLAYSLIEAAGGEDSITSLSTEKEDKVVSTSNSEYVFHSTSFYWGTDYNVDASGNYSLSGTIVKSSLTDCRSGTNTCGKYTIRNTTSETETSSYIYEITDFKTSGNYVSANKRQSVNDFYYTTDENASGMYKTSDDYGTSYYYRGNVTNNYVKFGTTGEDVEVILYTPCEYDGENFTCDEETVYGSSDECYEISNASDCLEVTATKAAGTSMYWRIVRINGDGTIRLIYNGLYKNENSSMIVPYEGVDSTLTPEQKIGYMYGTSVNPYVNTYSSNQKLAVDAWYELHLKNNYSPYIADSVFCNDRQYETVYYTSNYYEGEVTDEITEYRILTFASKKRYNSRKPSLKCVQQKDRFTVEDTTLGNGHLTNPVGLITADEVGFAALGTASSLSEFSSYITQSSYDTMSPAYVNYKYYDIDDGKLFSVYTYDSPLITDTTKSMRPVINLKSDVEFTIDEDGTYVITTD